MLDLDAAVDLDELALALEDQTDYEHRWLVGLRAGQLIVWTSAASMATPASRDRPLCPRLPHRGGRVPRHG